MLVSVTGEAAWFGWVGLLTVTGSLVVVVAVVVIVFVVALFFCCLIGIIEWLPT